MARFVADGTIFAIPVGVTGKYVKIPVYEIEKWRRAGGQRPGDAGGLVGMPGGVADDTRAEVVRLLARAERLQQEAADLVDAVKRLQGRQARSR